MGQPVLFLILDLKHEWGAAGYNPFASGSKSRTAAKAGTTDYARAGRRACDSPPKCRWRSAAGYPGPHTRAPATRSRKWSVQRPSLHNIYQKGGKVNPGRHLQSTLTEGLSAGQFACVWLGEVQSHFQRVIQLSEPGSG